MLEQTSASPLIDGSVPKDGAQPEVAPLSSSDPADLPNTLDAASGTLSDIGSKRQLPALVARISTPRRAARAVPVGILLYLLSVAIVATATVGIFFGIGFFLLAQSTEAMNANPNIGDHASGAKHRLPPTLNLPPILNNASSTYGKIASVPIEPPIPRSASTAALPVVPVAPPAAPPSPAGDLPASHEKYQSFDKGAPGSEARAAPPDISPPAAPTAEPVPGSSAPAPGSEARAASPDISPRAALTAEPVPGSSAPAPSPERNPRLSAGQITELLDRGDSFLHAGDVASARLFYERAADAGDWQAAIRMGATFDPVFLSRAGVRTVGEPTKAQSWYRHALDLGAPRTDRQVESPTTK